jgi:hypothetical protein
MGVGKETLYVHPTRSWKKQLPHMDDPLGK